MVSTSFLTLLYRKTIIHDTSSNTHKLTLQPEDENEDIKLRYEHHLNKSKTIETKYITVWTNNTYIPIPIYIYDKTLGCSFDMFTSNDNDEYPFTTSTSPCHSLPHYKQFDFGQITAKYSHERELKIINLNPLAIFVEKIRVSAPL